MDSFSFFATELELPLHHTLKITLTSIHYQVRGRLTWTGRKPLAVAVRFCTKTVIHSTCQCHSGGTCECGGEGGERMAPVRLEYVTKSDAKWRAVQDADLIVSSKANALERTRMLCPPTLRSGYSWCPPRSAKEGIVSLT